MPVVRKAAGRDSERHGSGAASLDEEQEEVQGTPTQDAPHRGNAPAMRARAFRWYRVGRGGVLAAVLSCRRCFRWSFQKKHRRFRILGGAILLLVIIQSLASLFLSSRRADTQQVVAGAHVAPREFPHPPPAASSSAAPQPVQDSVGQENSGRKTVVSQADLPPGNP